MMEKPPFINTKAIIKINNGKSAIKRTVNAIVLPLHNLGALRILFKARIAKTIVNGSISPRVGIDKIKKTSADKANG
jgi:hypothetical protein